MTGTTAPMGGSGFDVTTLLGGGLQTLVSTIMSSIVVVILVLVVILGAYWTLTGFKWLYIGRKAGLEKDWMPFVPFAKAIYRLRIVDESWWKIFFLEGWWLYCSVLYKIIEAISDGRWQTFGTILASLYAMCCIAYNVYWRYKYYNAFGIKPHMAIGILIPLTGGRRRGLDYQVAFTDNYEYTGAGTGRTVASTARSVVSVPKNGQGMPVAGQPSQGQRGGSITGLSGMYAGQELPLAAGDEMIIGRDNALCNLIVDQNADKLSRKHCGIVFDQARGVYMVTDYSTNGTFIDGGNRLVANMPAQLQRGTILALGNRENRFKLN